MGWAKHAPAKAGGAQRAVPTPASSCSAQAEHPVLRVDAVEAQRLFGNGSDYWIARFRGQ